MKLDIKHEKEKSSISKASENDYFRETYKLKRTYKRKGNESYFFNKEISEIKAIIPDVIYQYLIKVL